MRKLFLAKSQVTELIIYCLFFGHLITDMTRADHTDDVLTQLGFRTVDTSDDGASVTGDQNSPASLATSRNFNGDADSDGFFVNNQQPSGGIFDARPVPQQDFATRDIPPVLSVVGFGSNAPQQQQQPIFSNSNDADIPLELEFKQMEQKMKLREQQQNADSFINSDNNEKIFTTAATSPIRSLARVQQSQQNDKIRRQQVEIGGGGISNVELVGSTKPGTVFDIVFSRDFGLFDPRNSSSQFEFDDIAAEKNIGKEQTAEFTPALDNVAFLRQKFVSDVNNGGELVNMVSVPFSRWLPQRAGVPAILSGYEATVETKQPLAIGTGQMLSAALQFNCRTINTKLHKFPSGVILDAHDDQRLARCGFSLTATSDPTGIEFGIVATNKGIWATYSNLLLTRYELKLNYEAFSIYRRLASRGGGDEVVASSFNNPLIDARIEVDRRANNGGETRYYLNNELVWKVSQWGVLTNEIRNDPKNRLVSYSPGSGSAAAVPSSFALYLANTHIMDVGDALKSDGDATRSSALVKYASLPGYYPNSMSFADSGSSRASSLYGQGAIMGLKRLVVVRTGDEIINQAQARRIAATVDGNFKFPPFDRGGSSIADRVGSLGQAPAFPPQQLRQQGLVRNRRNFQPCFNGGCFFPRAAFSPLIARRRREMMGSIVGMFAL